MLGISEIVLIIILIIIITLVTSVIGGLILWGLARGLGKIENATFLNSWGLYWILSIAQTFIGAIFFGTTEITYSILVLHLILSGIYEIAFLTLKGATPGKILLGFRVVQSSNGKSPPTASSARNRFLPKDFHEK